MLIAFDGTCNKDFPKDKDDSNILKFSEAYHGVSFYQPGVGSGGWVDKLFGGFGGWGGKSRIKKAMDYLAVNGLAVNGQDTFIDVIGFSRGAALALDFCNEVNKKYKGSVKIRFLGIFDTVASFGLPGNNINIGYNFKLPHCVENCYHAMSLDERRGMFPLTRVTQDTLTDIPGSNITECWFRGFHSDIGGGNGNIQLSNIPLVWMMSIAKSHGINIVHHDFIIYSNECNKLAKCEKPTDPLPNDKRIIQSSDFVHDTVSFRKFACEGFEANNPPESLTVIGNL